MDVETELDQYVVETADDQNAITIENNTIFICSENGIQTQYVPYSIEDGKIMLKRLDDIEVRLEDDEVLETESEKPPVLQKQEPRYNRVLRQEKPKTQIMKRRKMSYETDFKPCTLPPNRGGLKNIIRYGRKHLIIDQQIMISPREFKEQLTSTKDLVMDQDLAPWTKQQMRHMLTGITRLFAYPAHKMPNNKLLQLYVSNCTSKEQPNLEKSTDMVLLPIGYQIEIDPTKIKRITRKRRYPEAEEYILKHQIAKDHDIQPLIDAAETASYDHGYTTKTLTDELTLKNTVDIEEDIKGEMKEEYLMESIDENPQNSIEVLLAAAAENSDEENCTPFQQIITVCEASENVNGQKVYILQQDRTENILKINTEYILP